VRYFLFTILLVFLISNSLSAQGNPIGLGQIFMSTSENILDCGFMSSFPYESFTVYFTIIPPIGGAKGARFNVLFDGPEDYLIASDLGYINESVVLSFSSENVFDGIDVKLNQCITETTIVFGYTFIILNTPVAEANFSLGEHSEGGLGLYDCSESVILKQTCTPVFLINNGDYLFGCYWDCPTVANKTSTWGVIKSIYINWKNKNPVYIEIFVHSY